MSMKPQRLAPKTLPLTEAETIALRHVANGAPVQPSLYQRLKKLGIIEAKADGWALTQDGHIRLMFDAAR